MLFITLNLVDPNLNRTSAHTYELLLMMFLHKVLGYCSEILLVIVPSGGGNDADNTAVSRLSEYPCLLTPYREALSGYEGTGFGHSFRVKNK